MITSAQKFHPAGLFSTLPVQECCFVFSFSRDRFKTSGDKEVHNYEPTVFQREGTREPR